MFFKNLNYIFLGLFLQTALCREKITKSPPNLADFLTNSEENKRQALLFCLSKFNLIEKFLSDDVLQEKPELQENYVALPEGGIFISSDIIIPAIVFYIDFDDFLEKFFVHLDKLGNNEVFFFELKTSLGETKLPVVQCKNILEHPYFQILKKRNSNFENLILGDPIIISWEEEIFDPKKNQKQNVTYMFELKKKAYLKEYMFSEEEKNALRKLIEKKHEFVGEKKVMLARIILRILFLNNLFEKNETKTLGHMSAYSFSIDNRIITDDDICFDSLLYHISKIKYILSLF